MRAPRLFPVLTLGMALSLCSAGAATQVCSEAELRNALATGGSVTFRCDQTIVLTSPLTITKDVELDAIDWTVTLSGGGTTRVFEVAPGATFSLRNLSVINGYHKGANAIYIPP